MLKTLKLETLAFVRELPSGDVFIAPAGDLRHACVGDEETGPLELSAFLTEHLGRVTPEEVARHAVPAGTRLHVTEVLIPREDLHRRFRVTEPVAITSIVIPAVKVEGRPARADAWVTIVSFRHTVFVREDEDLDEVVKREVLRLVAANEVSSGDYLALLPGLGDSLEPIEIEPAFGEGGPGGRAASLRKQILHHEKRKAAVKVLESVSQPLHSEWRADREHGRPLVSRERERELLAGLLGGKDRLSVLLVGESRVGKSALFRRWFEENEGRPEGSPLVYATSGAQLVAGMSGLGQWQERIRRVMDAAETLDAILVFDDLADLFAEHGQSSVDLAGAMKPYIEDGRVRILGELHPDRLDFIEARSPAFFAALHRVRLEPLDAKASLTALGSQVVFDRKRYADRATLTNEAWAPLVDLAARYLPYQAFPGKAVGLYRELVTARSMTSDAAPITATDVYDAVSARTGVPAFLLHEDRSLLKDDVERALAARVLGQTAAVRAIAETLCVVKAKLQPPDKPLATFLFIGPTGVGKTELARALATFLFGSESRMLRLDMSEYTDAAAAERLFRGGHGTSGVLTRKIREQPFQVVLLDEIEKAHPSVLDVLLQVCGEGRLTDARGKTAYFHDALIVMTSNLGATNRTRAIGVVPQDGGSSSRYVEAVEASFRPELVNRLDRIVVFEPLSRQDARRVVSLVIERVRMRRGLAESAVNVSVSEAAIDHLVDTGFSPEYGARSVRRHVEEALVGPIAELLAAEAADKAQARVTVVASAEVRPDPEAGAIVARSLEHNGLVFRADRRARSSVARDIEGASAVSRVRREMSSQLALDAIVAVREQRQLVFTQLHQATAPKKKSRKADVDSAAVTSLMTEHHRLNSIMEKLDAAHRDVLDLEELCLVALFDGHAFGDLRADVTRSRKDFRAALARAIVALEPKRDAAVLLLHELDGGRAFDLYLAPLLREGKRLGWTFTAHFPDESGEGWPADRRFGPPRPVEELLARLDGRSSRRTRSVMVSVKGENAGVFLAMESGVHRWEKVAANLTEALLLVQLLALAPTLTDDHWKSPAIAPVLPHLAGLHKKSSCVREWDGGSEVLSLLDGEVKLELKFGTYWPRFEEIALEHLLLCEQSDRYQRSSFLVELAAKPPAPAEGAENTQEAP